jgi:hypothetical protein
LYRCFRGPEEVQEVGRRDDAFILIVCGRLWLEIALTRLARAAAPLSARLGR